MGSLIFSARKMSLQSRINTINLKLVQLQNKQDRVLSDRAAQQPLKDFVETMLPQLAKAKGATTGGALGAGGGALAGAAIGSIIPGIGTVAGAIIGGLGGLVFGSKVGVAKEEMLLNKAFESAKNIQAFKDSQIDKKMDTEKQQLTTQLQMYQAELQNVEKAEGDAIKKGAPKYVA